MHSHAVVHAFAQAGMSDSRRMLGRLDLHTQTPEQQLEGKDAQRAQQLREDVAAIFRGFGGIASKYFLLLVLFPEAGEPFQTPTQEVSEAEPYSQRHLVWFVCRLSSLGGAECCGEVERLWMHLVEYGRVQTGGRSPLPYPTQRASCSPRLCLTLFDTV